MADHISFYVEDSYSDAVRQIQQVIQQRIEDGLSPDELTESFGLGCVFGGDKDNAQRDAFLQECGFSK